MNACDLRDGLTPIHYACKHGSFIAFLFLIANGADVNRVDNLGMTPLHYAVEGSILKESDYLITKLILKGALIHSVNNQGDTPHDLLSRYSSKSPLLNKLS